MVFLHPMKKLAFIAITLLNSCKSTVNQQKNNKSTLPAGTVVEADSQRILEEKLNDFFFSVKIKTTATSDKGNYTVNTEWGYYTAEGHLTMPKGGEDLQPVLRKGEEPYSYLIGFYFKDDTSFHDYYLIKGQKGMISMKYIKAYTFE
jgi:hypothetical protein